MQGYTASGHWQHSGGATNTICLPETPSWSNYSGGEDGDRNLVYGTEYGSSDASFSSIAGIYSRRIIFHICCYTVSD